uniref:Variant surface glycoprotein ILTAT 1.1BC n=1 Tax=Trypanosoma brucei brucei TaxID=5702 RepID=VSIB_TRYBB|nr:RecName: Full=Variant surface glycoprotein ILTAT 1.1BC; Short=VSG; Flags: Precursor [Trypanosoma brucei brucei]CAA24674.1 glycoprotein [Trypanosoma brucei]prf//0809312A protein,surface glyco [Trypanosoma brucei]
MVKAIASLMLLHIWAIEEIKAERQAPSVSRTECTTPCRCAQRLEKLKKHCQMRVQTAVRKQKENGKLAQKLLIGTITSTAGGGEQTSTTSFLLSNSSPTRRETLETNQAEIMSQLEHIIAMEAQYYAILNVSATSTDTTLDGDGTQYNTGSITSGGFTVSKTTECNTESPEDTKEPDQTTLSKKQGLKDLKLALRVKVACKNGGGACSAASSSDKIHITNETDSKNKGTTASTMNSQNTAVAFATDLQIVNWKSDHIDSNITALANALTALDSIPDLTDPAAYTADAAFKQLVATVTLNKPPTTELTGEVLDAVNRACADNYGTSASELTTKIWDPLNEQAASYYSDKTIKTDQLKLLTSNQQLTTALGVALAKAINVKEASKKECNLHGHETDATCEAKGVGDNCKPPCKEVEEGGKKKCKLDKEEAKRVAEQAATNQETEGKDGKTTNTTGSNSFLINKAPVLLAFLLL